MKIFIAGIPGMGKTSFSNYLVNAHGYCHIDMELGIFPLYNEENIQIALKEISGRKSNTVVSWGFPCFDRYFKFIRDLQDVGYKIIWFDGNEDFALKAFLDRGSTIPGFNRDGAISAFQIQVDRIRSSDAPSQIRADKRINTFKPDGSFLSFEEIFELVK